jgi:hypothetical protein
MEGCQIALLNGVFNRNEVRLKEGMNPVAGGDEYRVPLNTGAPGFDAAQASANPVPKEEPPRCQATRGR